MKIKNIFTHLRFDKSYKKLPKRIKDRASLAFKNVVKYIYEENLPKTILFNYWFIDRSF